MAKTQKQELAVIDFTQFSVAQLPELKGKKEEIKSVIEANPIVEIIDGTTFEAAKKSRTAVRTLRTSLESEQKAVKKRIKEFVLDVVDREYDTIVSGVKIAEQFRQSPIDAWEEKKEQERQEKLRLEQERIDNIKREISDYVASWKDAFNLMDFAKIKDVCNGFYESRDAIDPASFQEFDVLFVREVLVLAELLENRIFTLQEQEQIRIDNLVLEEKNIENTCIQEWQRTWNEIIYSLSFDHIASAKPYLATQKLDGLKHYVSAYEEIYLSTEKRLDSQIEFVSKAEEQRIAQEKFAREQAEIAKNNRIAQEKFEKEKKEFEEKQAEAKRKEEAKLQAEKLIEAALEVNEAIDLNVIDNQNYHEEDVDIKGIVVNKPIVFEALVEEIEETWSSIYEEFEKDNVQDEYDDTVIFVSWLEKNYNVPTKKQ
jgi:colicin import membrane protein